MKKILFATTALIATASVAAAEVKFGGYGRFGVFYDDGNTAQETRIESRFRLNIDGVVESDAGVTFSARVRMQADDNSDGTAGTAGLNGARFSAEAGGLRVDVGNIAGAIDNLPNYYGNEPGLTAFVGQYSGIDFGFDGYSSTGAGQNGVYARYETGPFAVAASYSDDTTDDEEWAIHFAYTGDTYEVAIGYADSDTDDTLLVLTGSVDIGPANITAIIADEEVGGVDNMAYGLSASFEVGAATDIIASVGLGDDNDYEAYGIGFVHDLGGGASIRGGVGSDDDDTEADLGVRFNF